MRLLLTCEHAGAEVPPRFRELFAEAGPLLTSHRGWDPGAWPLARHLARSLGAPLVGHHVTRLLVDANRSPGNPSFFSEVTRGLPDAEKRRIVRGFWEPHRLRVEERLEALLAGSPPVVHVGVHTFTPVLDGRPRDADVGLLYDPARPLEAALCAAWKEALADDDPGLRVRRNYPYRGVADGLVTALRRAHPPERYVGVELEVGQGILADAAGRRRLHRVLAATLPRALDATFPGAPDPAAGEPDRVAPRRHPSSGRPAP